MQYDSELIKLSETIGFSLVYGGGGIDVLVFTDPVTGIVYQVDNRFTGEMCKSLDDSAEVVISDSPNMGVIIGYTFASAREALFAVASPLFRYLASRKLAERLKQCSPGSEIVKNSQPEELPIIDFEVSHKLMERQLSCNYFDA